jgi:hypothetical protein
MLKYITVIFYPNNGGQYVSQHIDLKNTDGEVLDEVRCHPNDDIDIAVIRITEIYTSNPKISENHIGHGVLIPISKISTETYLGYGS